MGSIPMYDAVEFLSNGDQSGIIGFGSFGRVRDCFHRKLGRVAIKCFGIEGNAHDAEELRHKLSTEAEILQNINHQQIVQCQGVTVWSNAFGIIMEFMVGGNLDELLMNESVKFIPWGLRLRIIEELCEALSFLHYFTQVKTIVHGDLKPHNILLTSDLHAKLADFGAAQIALSTGSSSTLNDSLSRQHTVLYTAPEFLQDIHCARTPAMDIYSLSMIIYEVITRTRVFHGVTGNIGLIISTIVNCEQRPGLKQLAAVREKLQHEAQNGFKQDLKIFDLLQNLMKKCWHQNPVRRPQIGTIRDDLADELSLLDQGELIINVGRVVSQLKRTKSSQLTTMVPLSQFMFPFELANSRSRTISRSSLTTKASRGCVWEKEVKWDLLCVSFVDDYSISGFKIKRWPVQYPLGVYAVAPWVLWPLPHEWNNATAVVLDHCIYVISASAVELLDVDVSRPKWVRKPPMINPRTHAAAAAYKGKLYVFGGISSDRGALSSIECYDPNMESWSAFDFLKSNRFGHKVVEAKGKLCCIGGGNVSVESYDPITGIITDLTETPNQSGFDSVYCDGVIYDIAKGTRSAVVSYSLDCYNYERGFWYKGKELSSNRSQGCACAFDGKLYLVGGWGKSTSCQYVEVFDPAKDEWGTEASMNFGFVKHVCTVE